MADELLRVIIELDKLLINYNAPILKKLQLGISPSITKTLLSEKGITNTDLEILYKWRNGLDESFMTKTIAEIELFPGAIMLSLQEALIRYDLYTVSKLTWDKELFPIFTDGSGDYLLLSLKPESTGTNFIWLYSPSLLLSEEPVTIYDSLEALFKTTIQCFEQNVFFYDSQGEMDVDYKKRSEISVINNPNSEYWTL